MMDSPGPAEPDTRRGPVRTPVVDTPPPVTAQEVVAFLGELRQLREEAGRPSFRTMAQTAHYSHTALSSMLSAGRLPSRDLTLAFVRACGGDEDRWRRRWQSVHEAVSLPAVPAPAAEPAPRRLRRRWLVVGGGLAVGLLAVVAGTVVLASSPAPGADPEACNPLPAVDAVINARIDLLRTVTHAICAGLPHLYINKRSGTTTAGGQRLSYYVQRNPDGYVQLQLDGPQTVGHPAWSAYWQENPPDNPAHPECSWYQEQVKAAAGEPSWHTTGWLCPITRASGSAATVRLDDAQACNPLPASDARINRYIDELRTVTQPICTAMPVRTGVPLARDGGQTTGTTILDGREVSYFVQRYNDGYVQLQLEGPATAADHPDWSVLWQENRPDNPARPGCSPYQEQVDPADGGPPWRTGGWICPHP